MLARKRIRIEGIVQGVGFRPFIWNLATTHGLTGWVANDSAGVTIEVTGAQSAITRFVEALQNDPPPLAQIDRIDLADLGDVLTDDRNEFVIRSSVSVPDVATPVSPDMSVCDACLNELFNPANRRFRYPFINCTHCGPRFTIIEDIPYDRSMTTMRSFQMCPACQSEYDDPADRRFHAQPNACPECGPKIWFESPTGSESDTDDAIRRFHDAIDRGRLVAVKGIGGFHLACDATNPRAVAQLRERKGRDDKPFAVMVGDVDQARRFARVSDSEQALLESRQRPIVLLEKRSDVEQLAENVAPGNDFIGVMLPYSPLHYLLVQDRPPMVLTSGNVTDEPIARTNPEAKRRLSRLADGFLFHNRDIHAVCDDSVVRSVDGGLLPIRRSRGFAPMPVRLESDGPDVLALGGEIKATFCVTRERYALMSQHVGDMENFETLEAMERGVDHFLKLYRVTPKRIAVDLHPGYLSRQWGEALANRLGVPLVMVQHHAAHIASLLAEHGLQRHDGMIGCCLDGTGYGTDGTIWGGEFLVVDDEGCRRTAWLEPFPLPGGDACVRQPWRVAAALLWRDGIEPPRSLELAGVSKSQWKLLRQQLDRNLNCVTTSSMGRLFDAVASLLGVRHEVNYEAQAAMELEALANREIDRAIQGDCAFHVQPQLAGPIGTRPVIEALCDESQQGVSPAILSARFHHAVAGMIGAVAESIRGRTGIGRVGLSGGVFQNVLLLRLARAELESRGFQVLTHALVPPNDGGLALGQAWIAREDPERWRMSPRQE